MKIKRADKSKAKGAIYLSQVVPLFLVKKVIRILSKGTGNAQT
jgi:hypothetical protein